MIGVAPEVADALAERRPVVALESTIITHGMPYPQNVETALAVEAVVRAGGAVPASIAVVDGQLRIGLDATALERLGHGGCAKASRRDLAAIVARGGSAGTTVAATMHLAHRAGIAVFATGGIGGVHRGAESSWDISADLIAFARTPVAVVSAGAKSILDIGRTLEVLETQGVPIVGFGTDEFPAFYARSSGHAVEHRCDTPAEVARVIAAQRALGDPAGLLVVNPIPADDAIEGAQIEEVIARALAEAQDRGVTGKQATPFLLARIVALSDGRSLTANIALVRHNARLAAAIATALVALA